MAKRTRGSSQPGNRSNARTQPKAQRPGASERPAVDAGDLDELELTSAMNPDLDEGDFDDEGPVPAKPSGRLSKAEIDRAAAIEAEIVAKDRAAAQASGRIRDRGRRSEGEIRREARGFAAQVHEDYTYVSRDLRRVVYVNGGILALLLAAWAIISIAHIGPF